MSERHNKKLLMWYTQLKQLPDLLHLHDISTWLLVGVIPWIAD